MDKSTDALSWWGFKTKLQKKNLVALYFENKEYFEVTEADVISMKEKNDAVMPILIKKLEESENN